ncbi:unnamed protein product [Closterium sp. Naga37s-1]|nr:unnamed protein product [Closterium sp. Naga37s-1]
MSSGTSAQRTLNHGGSDRVDARLLDSRVLPQCLDAVEFCPSRDFPGTFAVASYQLVEPQASGDANVAATITADGSSQSDGETTNGKRQSRLGGVHLFNLDAVDADVSDDNGRLRDIKEPPFPSAARMVHLQSVSGCGILDIKWRSEGFLGRRAEADEQDEEIADLRERRENVAERGNSTEQMLLAAATADGTVDLYEMHGGPIAAAAPSLSLYTRIPFPPSDPAEPDTKPAMCLALDWWTAGEFEAGSGNREQQEADAGESGKGETDEEGVGERRRVWGVRRDRIAVSRSDGSLAVARQGEGGAWVAEHAWLAHEFEAWTCCFNIWDPEVAMIVRCVPGTSVHKFPPPLHPRSLHPPRGLHGATSRHTEPGSRLSAALPTLRISSHLGVTMSRFGGGKSVPGRIKLTRGEPQQAISPTSAVRAREGPEIDAAEILRPSNEERQLASKSRIQEASPPVAETAPAVVEPMPESRSLDTARVAKFRKELSAPAVDLDALRELSWSGIPPNLRPTVWRLLLGYAPPNADRRETVLARKRQEYREWVPQYYDIPNEDRSDDEIHTLRQISVDCPRTVPDVPFFQQTLMQTAIERVLYIWAIRHPASGYVQGINDLLTPFLTVFLSEIFEGDIDTWVVSKLSEDTLLQVEADSYWCLSKLLDGIQDHYTFAQPGIQRLVFRLKELVRRIDEPVSRHMEEHHLEFLQFAFRWFNCLLIREIPFSIVGRLWDTYLSEGDGFAEFLVYLCASFLLTWSEQLQQMDFQEMVLFLQHVPTKRWSEKELDMVLSRAFMWRVMFNRSPRHLNSS